MTEPDFPKKFPNSGKLAFLRVFGHLLENGSNDLAETSYLDSLDHYLQLSNWSHVQENSSSPFFLPKMVIFCHFWGFD